jgi:hypothetical protein
MNAALGWLLAAAAVAAGYMAYGARGVALASSVVVFWLLLQFSRALRALRTAAGRPVGSVASALMFNAKLHKGMRLPQVLALTQSLGRQVGESPEAWVWQDEGGDEVRVELHDGRVSGWALRRADGPAP